MYQLPIDFVVVRFAGTDFSSAIASSLKALIESNTIRIVDLLFLVKEPDGTVHVDELSDLDDAAYAGWDPAVGDVFGYLTAEDALLLSDSLPANSSAVLALVENTWAGQMVASIAEARGDVLISERLPRAVVEDFVRLHDQLLQS
jgi:uncharacterized membrane protein